MKTKELIQKEIEVFPEPYLEEVLDFIHLLKEKATKNRMETAILSESYVFSWPASRLAFGDYSILSAPMLPVSS